MNKYLSILLKTFHKLYYKRKGDNMDPITTAVAIMVVLYAANAFLG